LTDYQNMSEAEIVQRTDELNSLIEQEETFWQENQLPDPGQVWQFGASQFHHHCIMEAQTRIIKDVLGIDEGILNLVFKEVLLEELRNTRRGAKAARSEMLRRSITEGINIVRPPKRPDGV
jgi:hypothetical protein